MYIQQAVREIHFTSRNFCPHTISNIKLTSVWQRTIVFVENEQDVSTCVKFVAKHDLDVAVRGGGHSYHGASSADGLIIGGSDPFLP